MNAQDLVVITVVLVSVAFLLQSYYRTWVGQGSGCGCDTKCCGKSEPSLMSIEAPKSTKRAETGEP